MPEVAEVKLMSDYINCKNVTFSHITKSDKHKGSLPSFNLRFDRQLKSISRGKELAVTIGDEHVLTMTMGMSGMFIWSFSDVITPKHSHLQFHTEEGFTLHFVDPRRFGRWKQTNAWSANRGACPLTEPELFRSAANLLLNGDKFSHWSIAGLMMNQEVFNGVGNYLRAEILDRLQFSPFTLVSNLASSEIVSIIEMTIDCCKQSYLLGGGQLKDWSSPFGNDKKQFQSWMQCYGQKHSIIDKTGRRFWFDKKWLDNH